MAISLTFQNIGNQHCRRRRTAWLAALLATALIAVALIQGRGDQAGRPPVPDASAEARAVGVFTGEFVDGLPVYRLPSITVVGNRDTELAGMHRDGHASGVRKTCG